MYELSQSLFSRTWTAQGHHLEAPFMPGRHPIQARPRLHETSLVIVVHVYLGRLMCVQDAGGQGGLTSTISLDTG
jgi:hypothetical protein